MEKGENKAMQIFAEMIIDKINNLKGDWTKPWLNYSGQGLPENLSGRRYSNLNALMLYMQTERKGWLTPVYMTFNQASEMDVQINKGEKSFPVIYWNFSIKDEQGKKVDIEDYRKLSKEEQADYKVTPFLRYYNVFNIEQTNFATIKPDRWEGIKEKFAAPQLADANGMYTNKALDNLVSSQSWVCPIHCDRPNNQAYFSPSKDIIVLPMKGQFKKAGSADEVYSQGMAFYSTMLHEMTHSTGTKERLNRDMSGMFGGKEYGKEELVAELTSALVGQSQGFNKSLLDNNAAYLDSWLNAIQEKPNFILSVLSDVNKAATVINERLETIGLKEESSIEKEQEDKNKNAIVQQYDEAKKKHPDAIILFRSGDNYVTYKDDASIAGNILNINAAPIANVEAVSFSSNELDTNLAKLIHAGKRIAIHDQQVNNKEQKININESYKSSTELQEIFNNKLEAAINNRTVEKISGELISDLDKLNFMREKEGKEPLKMNNLEQYREKNEIVASIFKMRDGSSYAIRAKINGEQFSAKKLDKKDVSSFFDKSVTKEQLAEKYFGGKEIENKRENNLKR